MNARRDLVSTALGVMGFNVVHLLVFLASPPLLLYWPQTGAWSFAPKSGDAISLYGHTLFALLGLALGWSAGRLLSRPPSGAGDGLLAPAVYVAGLSALANIIYLFADNPLG
ncbi:MAG: hypothetical protein GMKNLPBB_01713 [Myxococcota bacterium]|nr:hypothetical protein [Myxococcota bacterium]